MTVVTKNLKTKYEEDVKKALQEEYMKAKHILILTKDTNGGQALSEEEITKKNVAFSKNSF